VAEVVELHTHVEEGGMMRMRRIERIALPVGESVQLQPGGLHVMLIGLKRDLHPGDLIDLTLVRDDGERIAIQAPVRKIEPRLMSAH
jgi:copper(I)-binding protein